MAFREDDPTVAVVGVTGVVGHEFIQVLSQHDFPYNSLKLFASRQSAGKQLPFQGKTYTVEELVPKSFDGVDIALFSAGGGISREFGPIAVEKGAIMVDNSSAFRMDPGVPLVISEVNPEAMSRDGCRILVRG
jgi:aspartate-semialdehyde dehydrogenase